jgi:hypothetical protein
MEKSWVSLAFKSILTVDLACTKKAYKNETAIAGLDMLARLIKELQLPTANKDLPILARKLRKMGFCGRHFTRSPSVIGSSPIGGATKLSPR